MITRNPAHEAEMRLVGGTYYVRRTLKIWQRIETRFGSLRRLQLRVATHDITLGELASLIEIILSDQDVVIRDAEIQEWIFRAGVGQAVTDVATFLTELYVGSDNLQALLDARDKDEESDESPLTAAA